MQEINYCCANGQFDIMIDKYKYDKMEIKYKIFTRILLFSGNINKILVYYKNLGLDSYYIPLAALKKLIYCDDKLKFLIDNGHIATSDIVYIVGYNYKYISLFGNNYNINIVELIAHTNIHFGHIIDECLKIGMTYDIICKQKYEDCNLLYYILNSDDNYNLEDIYLLFDKIICVKKELLITLMSNVYYDMTIISYGVMYGMLSNSNYIVIQKIIRYLKGTKLYQAVYHIDKNNIDKIISLCNE